MNKKFAKVYFLSAIMVALFLALINWNNTPIREKLNNMPIGILRPFIIPELDRNPVVLSDPTEKFELKIHDEGILMYINNGSTGYRYGPSIMKHEDGSMDAWFSSPGNSRNQWDWIMYRHSDDGIHWSGESIVLKPTANSSDQCSVCNPGVIYFNGYYYLGYTSTYDYARRGANNSAFVARSTTPYGPFEKWNGSGWGGYPQPIIKYEGDPSGWGIGEISFVIYGDDLFIYYTHFDPTGGYTGLAKADLTDDWPLTIRNKGLVCGVNSRDSLDVVYDETQERFMAFAVKNRMSESSEIAMYVSRNGKEEFEEVTDTKTYVSSYAHNMGIAKDEQGHIKSDETQLIGYAFGPRWGRWSTRFQDMDIEYTLEYK